MSKLKVPKSYKFSLGGGGGGGILGLFRSQVLAITSVNVDTRCGQGQGKIKSIIIIIRSTMDRKRFSLQSKKCESSISPYEYHHVLNGHFLLLALPR